MSSTTPTFSDADLLSAFDDTSLPIDRFHHAQHVRMAFLYLQTYEPLEAIARFSEALKRFAAAHGKPGLYHETITWAYLFLSASASPVPAHSKPGTSSPPTTPTC